MESGGALRRSEEEGVAAASVATCPECKKTFDSRKAMHGHLRSHPERNYRGADPNPRAKLAKTEIPPPPAADGGGDAGPPSLVVNRVLNTDFLLLMTEQERLQRKKLIKRRVLIKDDTEGNGECSTFAGVAPPSECECFVCRKRFSSYQALGGHMNFHTGSGITVRDAAVDTSPLMEAKELPVLSEKEWIAVYALKRLREAARSSTPRRAARPPLAFDLNQLPPSESEGEKKNQGQI